MMSFFFEKRFWPMWVAQNLGAVTDNMLKQALLNGITYGMLAIPVFTGDTSIPFIGALFGLAMIIFSPYGGQFADKYSTAIMFRRTKFAEMLIMSLAAVGFLLQDGVILVLGLFLMGAQSAFFNPTRISAMPKYLNNQELLRGNAFMLAGLYACITLGYVLGGGFIENVPKLAEVAAHGIAGQEVPISSGLQNLAMISVGLAVLGWLAIRLAPDHKADAPDLKIEWNWFKLIGQLTTYVKDEPPVIRPIIGIGIFYFIGTFITVLVPVYARDSLGAGGIVSVLFMGLFTLGSLLGALSTAFLAKGKSGLNFAATGVVVATAISLLVYVLSTKEVQVHHAELRNITTFFETPRSYLIAGLLFASSFSMGMYIVPLQTAVQRRVLPNHRARIIAAGNCVNAGAAILGSLLNLVITNTALVAHQAFILVAILQGGIAFYMIRRRASVPEGLYDEMLTPT